MALITFNSQIINPDEVSQINDVVQNYGKWYFLVFLSGVVHESPHYNSESAADTARDAFITDVENNMGGSGFIAGTVEYYANLPSPASSYLTKFYLVQKGSGGLLALVGRYKYPAGLYTPNASNVWEQAPFSVKVAEDANTLVSIPSGAWTNYIAISADINTGDVLIYDSAIYVNLTGTQTSTAPDSDTTNWGFLKLDVDYIDYNVNVGAVSSKAGRTYWNNDDLTVNIDTGLGPILSIGQETYTIIYNGTGSEIANGKVVYGIGIQQDAGGTGRISAALSDAEYHTKIASGTCISTMAIPDGRGTYNG